jgi:hypothetical protein
VNFSTDGDDLETLDISRSEAAPERKVSRSRRRLLRSSALIAGVGASLAGVLALAIRGDGGHGTSPRPSASPRTPSTTITASNITDAVVVELRLRPGEQKCPADRDLADSLGHATVADMTRRGAADGLPEDGATTIEHVSAAARSAAATITRAQRGVIAVTIGRGLGWTFSQRADSSVVYHHVDDFQVVVHLRHESDCPKYPSFVSNDLGRRVPSLFVYTPSA